MPDEKPPRPPEERAETEKEEEEREENERAQQQVLSLTLATRDLETLAGHCFDMGSALREKATAIRDGNLRKDILAAHKFNEAARQMKRMIGQVDRSHKRYLEANPDVE